MHTYLALQQVPAMEYAVVDTSKKRTSREQLKPDENKTVNVSVFNAVATHVCTYVISGIAASTTNRICCSGQK